MSLDQKRARWLGVLYLITFVTSIPALALHEPALRHPVAFIAGDGNVNKIYLGALLELLLIIERQARATPDGTVIAHGLDLFSPVVCDVLA